MNSGSWGIAARGSSLLLREQAYQAIKSGIVLQRWPAGTPLSEDQLAEELRMSRTPVREALQALAREGFVQILSARGTFVAGLSPDDLREIFEYREALESQTARLATERATDADLRELEQVVALSANRPGTLNGLSEAADDFQATLEQVEEFHRTGREFHGSLARVAGNLRIQEALSNLLCLTIPTRVGYGLTRPGDIAAEHRAIVQTIRRRDAEEAERLMRWHIRSTYDSLPSRAQSQPETAPTTISGG